MTLFEMLCIGGAALAAVLAAGRLLVNEVREAEDSIAPDMAAVNGLQAAPVKRKAAPAVRCDECHKSYSARSVLCPYCGAPPRVGHPISFIPLVLLGLACIIYTASFSQDNDGDAVPDWSQAPAMQKVRSTLIQELEDKKVIAAIRVAPHVVTVEVAQPAFRALQQFEQQTIGGTVFGYYFNGSDEADFVRLEDAETHLGLGWFNRWGLHLAEEKPAVVAQAAEKPKEKPRAKPVPVAEPSPITIK